MSSIPLYKAFIEVGASEESASKAAEDVIRVSQLPATGDKVRSEKRNCKAGSQYGCNGIPAYQMDGWLFVRFLPASSSPASA